MASGNERVTKIMSKAYLKDLNKLNNLSQNKEKEKAMEELLNKIGSFL